MENIAVGEDMDFQGFVNGFWGASCIVSVEKTEDSYGEIRLVAGNPEFIELTKEMNGYSGHGKESGDIPVFEPGAVYESVFTKDLIFEDLCYRAAVLKNPIHTCIHINKLDMWVNLHLTPLNVDEGKICYCVYSSNPCDASEINLASGSSDGTADDVLRTCVRLRGTDDFRQTMDGVIGDIRRICGAEVCTVMLMDDEAARGTILAISVREGSRLKRATQFPNFYDLAQSWLKMIGDGDCLIIKNEKDMKYVSEVNPVWYQSLAEAGVESVVMFPLRYNREVHGFIWATNYDVNNVLRIKETLELTTFFIASEIAGYRMLERLRHIGYTDMLTGVKNRNAMNNRVIGIVEGTEFFRTPFGVIFVDLNGLKQVNDNMGHTAGDLLLKKAALLLQERFADGEVYRAGGDEFVVFLPGCDAEAFEKMLNVLRTESDDANNVSFAVGGYLSDTGGDIREAMHLADEAMYKDKEEYYQRHPERRQR